MENDSVCWSLNAGQWDVRER